MEDLKPCPFCGCKGKIQEWTEWVKVNAVIRIPSTRYFIGCGSKSKCKITPETPTYDTKEEAIKVWNRRS